MMFWQRKMIELAKHTGDITRYPVKLGHDRFNQSNFYTSHFGGLYIFHDLEQPGCVVHGEKDGLGPLPIDLVINAAARDDVAAFLTRNDLVEPIISARGMDAPSVLKQKLDFIVIDTAANAGEDLSQVSRHDLHQLRRKLFKHLPEEFHGLNALWRWSTNRGPKPNIHPNHPAYFYTLRSGHHKDKYLVNMLLAQLAPLDFRQLFICHKSAFYAAYRDWSDQKKEFAARFLEAEYLVDKAGARLDLFGPEPDMFDNGDFGDEEYGAAGNDPDDFDVEDSDMRRGPWGPIPK